MRKHLKLITFFIEMNLKKALEYRAEVFFVTINTIVYTIFFLLSIKFVFNKIPSIKGIDATTMYIYILLTQLWFYLYVIFVRKNFQDLSNAINKGTFDFYLIKPFSLKTLTPFLRFDFRHIIPSLLYAIIVVILTWSQISSTYLIFIATFFLFNGVAISFFINSIFTASNFWVGRNYMIFDLFYEYPEFVKIPVQFFTPVMSTIFTFLIPVTIIINPTVKALNGKLDIKFALTAILFTIILGIFSEIVWKLGLKKYSSGS